MKIALIKCSGGLNLGNEFINAGGEYLVKRMFYNKEADIYDFEFYDSCIKENYKYPSKSFTVSTINFLNTCDYIFVFCGSIISKYCRELLIDISKIKSKKILIGAGAYQYDNFEKELCYELAELYDYIFTRDEVTYSYFPKKNNIINGIDLGFFAGDAINIPREKGDYSVINIDLIKNNKDIIQNYSDNLHLDYDEVYIVENTTTKYQDVKNYIYMAYWQSLYCLYANSAYVVTNRIHTSVVCLINCIPFKYIGSDSGGIKGRNTLFNQFGFKLERNRYYSKKELSEYSEIIKKRKKIFFNDFIDLLNNL